MRLENFIRAGLCALILATVLSAASVYAACESPSQGILCVASPDGSGTVEVPLKHTEVRAEISGMIASAEVTQTFTNPYNEVIEAIYVFPLPENSAVNDMEMKIGERTIRGLIKKREEARKIYEEAKSKGHVASLLDQERPNIFTQSVANIEPGAEILITIRYIQDLKYDRGEYEFVFPMVVGPRFIPGKPTGKKGGGWSPDTDRVPDASRITPPVLKPGTRSGHDINVTVHLDAGVPIQGIHSTSHEVDVARAGASGARISLHPDDTIPNKDFIVRYAVAGNKPEMALLTHRSDLGGYFMLMIQPQAHFTPGEITPKEMIFVLDTSGSMSGEPTAKVKQAMRKALRSMNRDDTFQIIQFSSGLTAFPEKPMTNSRENVERGLSYINGIRAGGGTRMLPAIEAALKTPHDPGRLRIVCLMTDGYIGNEHEIFAAIQKHRETSRVFVFGVGSSVNRYLVTRAGKLGRGDSQVIRHDEPTDPAVERFYDRIARPNLTDIEIDWGALKVSDLYPAAVPDLFAEQPVILFGRYEKPGSARVVVGGKIAGVEARFKLSVSLPEAEPENESLASLWARLRIEELEAEQHWGGQADVSQAITEIALKHRLMSRYTSFVAVEEQRVIESNGKVRTVQVPVEMPEGVSFEGVFGEAFESGAPSLRSLGYIGGSPSSKLSMKSARSPHVATSRGSGRYGSADASKAPVGTEESAAEDAAQRRPQPIPEFQLTLTTAETKGRGQRIELRPSGEVWLIERDAAGATVHQRLLRRLTLAERREVWVLIGALGLPKAASHRIGTGEPVTTLVLTGVGGKTSTLHVGADARASSLPAELQRLLELMGP